MSYFFVCLVVFAVVENWTFEFDHVLSPEIQISPFPGAGLCGFSGFAVCCFRAGGQSEVGTEGLLKSSLSLCLSPVCVVTTLSLLNARSGFSFFP